MLLNQRGAVAPGFVVAGVGAGKVSFGGAGACTVELEACAVSTGAVEVSAAAAPMVPRRGSIRPA